MKISALLTAIEADLKANADLSSVRDIAVTPGRFNADEITRRSFKAPALRIAFLGAPRTRANANRSRRFEGAFAVFVLTDGRGRVTEGVDIVEVVAAGIEDNRFSENAIGLGLPDNLRIDVLYSGDVEDKGISLYSVSWTQAFHIGSQAGLGEPRDGALTPGGEINLDTHIVRTPRGV